MQIQVKRIIGTVVAAGALAVAPTVASAAPLTLADGGSASVTASAPSHDGNTFKPMFCNESNPCVM